MLTLDEAKEFLRVDGTDDDVYIQSLIELSEGLIEGCVMDHSIKKLKPKYTVKAKQLMRLLINEAYNNRTLVAENDQKLTFATKTIMSQLRYGVYP